MSDYDFSRLLSVSPTEAAKIEQNESLDGVLAGRRVLGIAAETIKRGDTILVPLNGKSFSNKIFKTRP